MKQHFLYGRCFYQNHVLAAFFKGTMEKLTLLRDFWPKLRDMWVYFVRFWSADVKLVVEHE
jgi:hypothetical protein